MLYREKNAGKHIAEMIHAVTWMIDDPPEIELENMYIHSKKKVLVDAIVNSASPDLMGGDTGTVDWEIHRMVDRHLLPMRKTFNQKICEELSQGNDRMHIRDNEIIKRIRCSRGKAVMTGGYGFCRYVIHAVGVQYQDKNIPSEKQRKMFDTCCSSSVQIMESCYHEIIKLVCLYPDIKNVAIPIIGSGNYGFDMEFASRIAVSAVGNALAEWKQNDQESFETSALENIIFFVKSESDCSIINKIIYNYMPIYEKGHQVVCQDSFTAQKQYYNEILIHDEKRGYFAIAGMFWRILLRIRMFFGVLSNLAKEIVGRCDWQRRRLAVEATTAVKLLFPILGFLLVHYCEIIGKTNWVHFIGIVLFYFMADTVTYLAALIMMADIQKPSANVIRSLLLLFFNYAEVSLDMAYFYYVYHLGGGGVAEALEFGVLDVRGTGTAAVYLPDIILIYGNAALKFFFLTMVFGYLVQHMHLRKFKGE